MLDVMPVCVCYNMPLCSQQSKWRSYKRKDPGFHLDGGQHQWGQPVLWPRCELGISKITDSLRRAHLHGCFCAFSRHSDNKSYARHVAWVDKKQKEAWALKSLEVSGWKTTTKMEEKY